MLFVVFCRKEAFVTPLIIPSPAWRISLQTSQLSFLTGILHIILWSSCIVVFAHKKLVSAYRAISLDLDWSIILLVFLYRNTRSIFVSFCFSHTHPLHDAIHIRIGDLIGSFHADKRCPPLFTCTDLLEFLFGSIYSKEYNKSAGRQR